LLGLASTEPEIWYSGKPGEEDFRSSYFFVLLKASRPEADFKVQLELL
jgi:hypothetical protein